VQLPDRLARELADAGPDFIAEVFELGLRTRKIDQALAEYASGHLTLGAAARLADVPEDEMARQAYARGLEPKFASTTLAEELG
jgi:predicted HTH domain antitoxin